jgi:hypothetical protein
MVLASKARNLIELSISMTTYHVEVTYLPEDPRLLPSLRTFQLNIPGGVALNTPSSNPSFPDGICAAVTTYFNSNVVFFKFRER